MPTIKKIDHIGIVVSNLQEAIERYKNLLFQGPPHMEFFEPAKIELAFFDIGGVSIELLAPTAPTGDLWAFLKERGGGLHHICYQVDDIHGVLESLKAQGFKLLDEKPRPGSRHSQIAFVNPVSASGVLTEYCQFPQT
ncbi:MAG: VOC family protein [Deltaproteobacteria bacterium]|nr:VOC family protein [Deltaproteobacteria bacterium]